MLMTEILREKGTTHGAWLCVNDVLAGGPPSAARSGYVAAFSFKALTYSFRILRRGLVLIDCVCALSSTMLAYLLVNTGKYGGEKVMLLHIKHVACGGRRTTMTVEPRLSLLPWLPSCSLSLISSVMSMDAGLAGLTDLSLGSVLFLVEILPLLDERLASS